MPLNNKFVTVPTGKKIIKIGQYLEKIRTNYNSLLLLGHPVEKNLLLRYLTIKLNQCIVGLCIVKFCINHVLGRRQILQSAWLLSEYNCRK